MIQWKLSKLSKAVFSKSIVVHCVSRCPAGELSVRQQLCTCQFHAPPPGVPIPQVGI